MITLSTIKNSSRPRKKIQRLGRGESSGRGKTCCRGNKGDKSRSGYKRRHGNEGGQLPLYRKLPVRGGFIRGPFRNEQLALNLGIIDTLFNDGEIVNYESLQKLGYAPRRYSGGIKILSKGNLTKKVTIEANRYSEGAIKKLQELSISYKIIPLNEMSN